MTKSRNDENAYLNSIKESIKQYLERDPHGVIIKVMKSFGCKSDEGGVCQGIAYMSMQAFQLGIDKKSKTDELDVFNKHIDFIVEKAAQALLSDLKNMGKAKIEKTHTPNSETHSAESEINNILMKLQNSDSDYLVISYKKYFKKLIINCLIQAATAYFNKESFTELSKEEKEKSMLLIDSYFNTLTSSQKEKKALGFNALFEKLKTDELREAQKIALKKALEEWNEIKAVEVWAQGIDLYYNIDYFVSEGLLDGSHFSLQDSDQVIPILSPVNMDAREKFNNETLSNETLQLANFNGKECKKSFCFESFLELEKYLLNFMNELKQMEQRVSFIIKSGYHTIHIGFDILKNQYVFTNAGRAEKFNTAHELAKNIAFAFGPQNIAAEKIKPLILNLAAYANTGDVLVQEKISKAFFNPKAYSMPELALGKGNQLFYNQEDGFALLHMAVKGNDYETINDLFDQGIDVNMQSADSRISIGRWTPLNLAAANKNFEVVEFLLTCGADPNLANSDNVTPILLATENNDFEMVKLLLEYRADANIASTKNGASPLATAVNNQNFKIVELVLNDGADPNLANDDNVTAIMFAIEDNNFEIVKLLLKHGADVNVASNYDQATPLYRAFELNNSKIIELILKYGNINWDAEVADLQDKIKTPQDENLNSYNFSIFHHPDTANEHQDEANLNDENTNAKKTSQKKPRNT